MELLTSALILGYPSNSTLGPDVERFLILKAADEYDLDEDETALLLALRAAENGKAGLEYGVGSDNPKHQARRHKDNPAKSLETQARWAAGTIKKRYNGNLETFMLRWNPSDPNEINNVVFFLNKRQRRNHVR